MTVTALNTIEAARLSFEQTIARLIEEVAEIDAFLAANPEAAYGDDFTVVLRLVFKGEKTTPTGLRQVGEGFNFNGTTPATTYAMGHNKAQLNAQRMNAAARRELKNDVEYSVMGLRALFLKQRTSKAESIAYMTEMLANAPAS